MRRSDFAALAGLILLALAPALAQPPTAPASPTTELAGVADWWWFVVLVLVIALAIGYFMRRRRLP
jgi:predicted cobalt transporter CbtA